jgi:hypothetical protein
MIGEETWGANCADPLKEDPTMLKTISAALLAASVFAAPSLAATAANTANTKTAPAKTAAAPAKTTQAPVIKAAQNNPKLMNANAHMGKPHRHHRHHRHHKY